VAAATHEHLFDKTARECKGVLLNFEDTAGKVWSRSVKEKPVKEKGLHAGDAVGFYSSAGTQPWR
jgi:RAV-like factor